MHLSGRGTLPVVVAVAALCSLASAPVAHAKTPRGQAAIYLYDVRVGVKGGATLDGSYPNSAASARPDDAIEEHFKASFSIDGRFPNVLLVPTKVRGYPSTYDTTETAVVNGTWANQGTKWIDPQAASTGPFTCSGGIEPSTPQAATVMKYRRQGSKLAFTLKVLADLLVSPGGCSGVNGAQGDMSYANSNAYVTKFTVSRSEAGRKTIVKPISGPTASLPWRQYACGNCTFNTAWQGTVRLTRRRTMHVPRAAAAGSADAGRPRLTSASHSAVVEEAARLFRYRVLPTP